MLKRMFLAMILVLSLAAFIFPKPIFSANLFDFDEDQPGEIKTIPPEENKTSGISLSGSTNYLAKFLSATGLGNSVLYESGGKVGIGTINPAVSLHNEGDFITKGPWVDVRAFGAKGDGITDDLAAFNSALEALPSGGELLIPSGRFRFSAPWVVNKSNITIRGTAQGATILQGDLAVASVMQIGIFESPVANITICDLTVSRASGTPGESTIGIHYYHFNYVYTVNVRVTNHGEGMVVTCPDNGGVTIGWRGLHCEFDNAVTGYLRFERVADAAVSGSAFGRNGGELFTPKYAIAFSETANDIRIENSEIIPRGPQSFTQTDAFAWLGMTNTTGVFRLSNLVGENFNRLFYADAATTYITQLVLLNSRIGGTGPLFATDGSPSLFGLNITKNDLTFTNTTFAGLKGSRFEGNYIDGAITFNAGDVVVTGNTFSTVTNFTGDFASLVLADNNFVFYNAEIYPDLSGATGNISVIGNGKNIGSAVDTIIQGNVGIGTMEPNSKLHIYEDLLTYAGIRLQNTAGTASDWVVQSDGGNAGQGAAFTIYSSTAGEYRLFINGDGDVGIGTTSPGYKLDVEGDVQAYSFNTGDIVFQKDDQKLWRMFEEEDGLYLENLKTGKTSRVYLEDDSISLKEKIEKIEELENRIAQLEKQGSFAQLAQ